MKNLKLFLSVVFVLLLFNSCENEEDLFIEDATMGVEVLERNSDTNMLMRRTVVLTFGRFFGKCTGGPCVNIYRLTSDELLQDSVDKYPSRDDFYNGKFEKFKGSERILTKGLLSEFPYELLGSKNRVIGSPDAGDWGGVYLEYRDDVNHEFWILDLNSNNLPKNLRNYVDLIDRTVNNIDEKRDPIKVINNLN